MRHRQSPPFHKEEVGRDLINRRNLPLHPLKEGDNKDFTPSNGG
jgi:hypothetical protein